MPRRYMQLFKYVGAAQTVRVDQELTHSCSILVESPVVFLGFGATLSKHASVHACGNTGYGWVPRIACTLPCLTEIWQVLTHWVWLTPCKGV